MKPKIQKIKDAVEKELSCSAHNMEHIMRVYNLCMRIAEEEGGDVETLQASALLHDIARAKEDSDPSGKTDHAVLSAKMAVQILQGLEFPEEKIKRIQECIISHRYRTGNRPKTKEAQILFDADKLETVGALGIARCFMWIGKNNARMYAKPDINEYAKENLCGKINGRIQDTSRHSPQIEFETKLKFLTEKLYTQKGKEIAKERTQFYSNFLDRLEREINGEL